MNHSLGSAPRNAGRRIWTPPLALGIGLLVGGLLGFGARSLVPGTPERKTHERTLVTRSSPSPGKSGNAPPLARAPAPPDANVSASALRQDIATRLQEIFEVVDFEERTNALRALLATISAEELPLLIDTFFALTKENRWDKGSELRGMSLLEMIAGHIVTIAPESFLNDALKRDNQDIVPLIFRQWTARDFRAALGFFETQIKADKSDSLKNDCAEAAAHEFAKQDPVATFNWIMTLDEEQRDDATNAAFRTLSHYDLAAAARLLSERGDITNRESVAGSVAGRWAKHDPENALAWAVTLPPDVGRDAIAASLNAIAEKSTGGELLARWEKLPDHGKDAALPAVAGRAIEAMGAAQFSALLAAQPEGKGHAQAASKVMDQWARLDPVASSRWLAELPSGQTRDAAVRTFTRQLESSDPEAAVTWASTINDQELRNKALTGAFRAWDSVDRDAAVTWLQSPQSSGISAAEREELSKLYRPSTR